MRSIFLATAGAALLASPAFAATKTYELEGFTRVSAAAGTTVNVTVGGDYSVRAESTSEGLERLDVKLVGDELQIGRKHKGFSFRRSDNVVVTVTTPALNGIGVSSGASANATGVDAAAFEIDVSSGGSLDITGRCESLTVDVSSGGSVDAETLQCRSAMADASSGGSADIYASESITGDASSGGSIDVAGSPKTVNKDTSSGGSVDVD